MEQKFDITTSNAVLRFTLASPNCLIIHAVMKQDKQSIFQQKVTNQNLSDLLKKKFGSVDIFYQQVQFEAPSFKFNVEKSDVQMKLKFQIKEKGKTIQSQISLKPISQSKIKNIPKELSDVFVPKKQPVILKDKSDIKQNVEIKQKAIEKQKQQNKQQKQQQKKSQPLRKFQPPKKIQILQKRIQQPPKKIIQQPPKKIQILQKKIIQQPVPNIQKKKQSYIQSPQLKLLKQQQNLLNKQIQNLHTAILLKQEQQQNKILQLQQLYQRRMIVSDQTVGIKQLLEQTKKKYLQNPIEASQKYKQYVHQDQGKKKFFMRQMQVNDDMIKEIVVFDMKKIQILSLGDNKITDIGFDLLFLKNQWPILSSIFLQNNKIKNIHSLNNFDGLQTLSLYQNPLSQKSCNFIVEYWWPSLKQFRVSFQPGLNSKCWQIILESIQQKFPNLEQLYYSNNDDISNQVKQKILNYCNTKGVSLNHSIKNDQLQTLLKFQLLADILKSAEEQKQLP